MTSVRPGNGASSVMRIGCADRPDRPSAERAPRLTGDNKRGLERTISTMARRFRALHPAKASIGTRPGVHHCNHGPAIAPIRC